MLLSFDADGFLIGTVAAPYPCPAEQLANASAGGHQVIDVPPFEPAYWQLVDGQPRIRERLRYETKQEPSGAGMLFYLTGLPAGVAVTVAGPFGGEVKSDGGQVELLFQQPGEYRVSLALTPYQPEMIVVHAAGENA